MKKSRRRSFKKPRKPFENEKNFESLEKKISRVPSGAKGPRTEDDPIYFTRVQILVFPIREIPMNPLTFSVSRFSRVILHL